MIGNERNEGHRHFVRVKLESSLSTDRKALSPRPKLKKQSFTEKSDKDQSGVVAPDEDDSYISSLDAINQTNIAHSPLFPLFTSSLSCLGSFSGDLDPRNAMNPQNPVAAIDPQFSRRALLRQIINQNLTFPMENGSFQQHVIRSLNTLTVEQDHLRCLVESLSNAFRSHLTPDEIPEGMPNLPLQDMTEFNAMEDWLLVKTNATYLSKKLVATGAPSLRAGMLTNLKMLMSNELAMQFNWAGHNEKRSFQNTRLKEIMMDAGKIEFAKDWSDKEGINAIQNWLKLAKSRYMYNLKNNPPPSVYQYDYAPGNHARDPSMR